MKYVLLIIMILMNLSLIGCRDDKFEHSDVFMGTVITLKATGKNSDVAVNESFERIAELEQIIAADKKNLEDAAGNDFVEISDEVFEMLTIAQNFSEMTDGTFDITIGAATELWSDARKNKIPPTVDEISRVKNLVGCRRD